MTGAVTYFFVMDGRRCDDEDMSRLSLARDRRSRSYSSSDISELELSEFEPDPELEVSSSGKAPGTLRPRADIGCVDGFRLDGKFCGADVAVALAGVAMRAEYARCNLAEVLKVGDVGEGMVGEGCDCIGYAWTWVWAWA